MVWCVGRLRGVRDTEFLEYINSLMNALATTIMSLFVMCSYSESDILTISNSLRDNTNYQLPLLVILFRFFCVFQTAFFAVSGVQILVGFEKRGWPYRIVLVIHHVICMLCACANYNLDPYLNYIYAINILLEISSVFTALRFFGRLLENATLYGIGGIGVFVFYPLRVPLTVYCGYTVYFGSVHLFTSPACVFTMLFANLFVCLLSMYYSIVLFANPKALCVLKFKQKHV